MRDVIRFPSLLAVVGAAIIVAGCAQSGAGGNPTQAAASQAAAASEAPAGSPTVFTVDAHQDPSLGMILTGAGGKTLYLLTKDSTGSSTCTGNCAKTWPPFTLNGGDSAVAGSGVTGTISTIQRPDGTSQVAINGKPLYYFSGDSAVGETNGEGINGVWFAVGADGSAVQAPSPSATSGGYHY